MAAKCHRSSIRSLGSVNARNFHSFELAPSGAGGRAHAKYALFPSAVEIRQGWIIKGKMGGLILRMKFWIGVLNSGAEKSFGGIAQLVERLVRNEKARGSNPLTSIYIISNCRSRKCELSTFTNSASVPRLHTFEDVYFCAEGARENTTLSKKANKAFTEVLLAGYSRRKRVDTGSKRACGTSVHGRRQITDARTLTDRYKQRDWEQTGENSQARSATRADRGDFHRTSGRP